MTLKLAELATRRHVREMLPNRPLRAACEADASRRAGSTGEPKGLASALHGEALALGRAEGGEGEGAHASSSSRGATDLTYFRTTGQRVKRVSARGEALAAEAGGGAKPRRRALGNWWPASRRRWGDTEITRKRSGELVTGRLPTSDVARRRWTSCEGGPGSPPRRSAGRSSPLLEVSGWKRVFVGGAGWALP
jgi:hypothetical protein